MSEEVRPDDDAPRAAADSAVRAGRPRKGFLPRVSLKLLLLLGVLGSLPLAWLAPDAYWLQREREAVARIQAVRGNLVISEDGKRNITASEAIAWRWGRRTLDVQYETVVLDAHHGAGDEEVAHLPALRGIAYVSLRGPSFTDASVEALAKLPKLRTVTLDDTRLSRSGLAELSELSPMEHLICRSAPGGHDLLESVDAMPELRALSGFTFHLSLPAAEAIAKLERLETLQLHVHGGVHPQALRHLLANPALKSLDLHLPDATPDDERLQSLARMSELEYVTIYPCQAGDAGIAELAKLPRLKHLRVRSSQPTNAGVETLAKIPTLELVELIGWNVDDGALDSLRKLPNLRLLFVDDKLSLDSLVQFQQDRPDCEIHRQSNGRSALLEEWIRERDQSTERSTPDEPL